MLNCLCQPGLLLNRPQKSMRENINPLIKSCGTRTVLAAETKSIGLAAHAQVSWFLQTHLDSFIMTRQLSFTYRDLVPLRQIIVTIDFSIVYRDWQKPSHRDTGGNSPNRRAVMLKQLVLRQLSNQNKKPKQLSEKELDFSVLTILPSPKHYASDFNKSYQIFNTVINPAVFKYS